MSTTLPKFYFFSVLSKKPLAHSMASLFTGHISPFISSYITLSFEVKIHIHLFHYDLKTQDHQDLFQGHHHKELRLTFVVSSRSHFNVF